jgi:hypothetical protein
MLVADRAAVAMELASSLTSGLLMMSVSPSLDRSLLPLKPVHFLAPER